MLGAVRRLAGFQYLAGMLNEVVCRLAPVRANGFDETSDIVKGSLGSEPAHLFKCLLTDRACAFKVALLGVGAG
jgi:hypothetical protein